MSNSFFEWANELFSREKIFEKPEALKGIRVLDVSQVLIGPETASLLADFGAEVIKIEPPGMGELLRSVDLWSRFWRNNSVGVMWVQRNKYFFGLNLKHPKGKAIFYELVKRSDVIVENYVPGVMERLEISYKHLSEINPRLIYISISGFGQWGERWNWPSCKRCFCCFRLSREDSYETPILPRRHAGRGCSFYGCCCRPLS